MRDRLGGVGAGKLCVLEQHEQPRERRAQLVRDGGGEPGAQLLVGGELARVAAQVDEPLLPAVHLVGDDDRPPLGVFVEQLRCQGLPLLDPAERLTGAPARGDDDVALVEDEHDLRALLDQEPAARRFDRHVPPFGVLSAVPYAEAAHHHLLTESSLLWHPRSTPWARS